MEGRPKQAPVMLFMGKWVSLAIFNAFEENMHSKYMYLHLNLDFTTRGHLALSRDIFI